jgi:tetratricopeptide (TPR) repeat protein
MPRRSMQSRRRRCPARLAPLIGALWLAASASPADAARMCFGTQEYLTPIQDVAITGPAGEALYLGYKHSFYCFVLPYTLSDDGYILGAKGGGNRYYRLDQARIAQYQASGLLPSPLPPYRLSLLDRVVGHSIWAVPVPLAGLVAYALWRQKGRKQALPYFARALHRALYRDENELDGAIADYSKAIEIDSHLDQAFMNRGELYALRGDHDRAIADFTRAIKLGSRQVVLQGLINRGIAYQQKGDFDRAIADLTRVIKEAERSLRFFKHATAYAGIAASARQARGDAYAKQGDMRAAQADHEAARRFSEQQSAMH